MKFIHIADVHLGMQPDKGKKWSQEREREIWESFAAIIDIVAAEKPDLLLIAGDLFHENPKVHELKEVNAFFSKLADTRVVLIAGNHDYLRTGSKFDTFEWNANVTFIRSSEVEGVYFDDIKTSVYGFSFNRRCIKEEILKEVQAGEGAEYNILLAHGGETGNVPMDFKKLARAGFDYVALGHIHKPGQVAPNIWYSGSLEPLDRNETGEHGYILGEITSAGCAVRFVPIAVKNYIHAVLEVDGTTTNLSLREKIAEYEKQQGEENIYCFDIKGFRDPEVTFEAEAANYPGNVAEIRDFSEPDYDFERLEQENADNVIGMFIREIQNSDKPEEIKRRALYCGLSELLK